MSFEPNKAALDRERLSEVRTYDEFFSLRQSIARARIPDLSDLLINLALNRGSDNASGIAGYLLIELDPPPTKTCREYLEAVASSTWDLSDRSIPFYLVTQFGKGVVLSEVRTVASQCRTKEARVLVEGVGYWASAPAKCLAEPLHYWEWQEVIEGDDA